MRKYAQQNSATCRVTLCLLCGKLQSDIARFCCGYFRILRGCITADFRLQSKFLKYYDHSPCFVLARHSFHMHEASTVILTFFPTSVSLCSTIPHVAIPIRRSGSCVSIDECDATVCPRTASPTCFITPVFVPPVKIHAPVVRAACGYKTIRLMGGSVLVEDLDKKKKRRMELALKPWRGTQTSPFDVTERPALIQYHPSLPMILIVSAAHFNNFFELQNRTLFPDIIPRSYTTTSTQTFLWSLAHHPHIPLIVPDVKLASAWDARQSSSRLPSLILGV